MIKFIMMVGLPGSGKSQHAKDLAILEGAKIIESDDIREKVFGGKQDKNTNTKLFDMVHEQILEGLKTSSVIFDATNISYKNRMAIISKVRLNHKSVQIVAHVMMTQYEICIERDSQRQRSVGEEVIKRMRENFWMPQYFEGFDEIVISYKYSPDDYTVESYEEKTLDFNQENPNHSKTLYEHCFSVAEYLNDFPINPSVGFLHDIGKYYTKVKNNMKGEPTSVAHYYGHESVSAYESFFYFLDEYDSQSSDLIYNCGLINYHMRLYQCKTEKSHNKLRFLVGDGMYKDLIILNNADIASK